MPQLSRKSNRKSKQSRPSDQLFDRGSKGLERLESRQLMAAHIVGDPTVYATIQAAVNAALPKATINVDAGAYSEQVYIGKSLTIRGAQAGKDARSNVRTSASESIINGALLADGTRSSSFYIAANDVTIDGFTVQGNTQIGDTGAGMVIAPSISGTRVFDNVIQNNVAGLFLANASATDPAVIRFNIFRNNNNPGSNGGRGIYTNGGISGGNLTNVLIDSNAFISNFGSTGTTLVEGAIALESRTLNSQHNITITNNVFDTNGKSVLVYNADHLDIENNLATNGKDQWSAAFRFEGGASNVNIIGNTVFANTGPAVRVDEKGFAGPNFNFVVTGNNFYGNSTAYTNHQSVVLSALNQYDGTFVVTNNYWGNATGPSGDGPGTGDNLTLMGNSAIFSPWATSMIGTGRMPYYGAPLSTDALVQLEDYDQGGEGVAYHDLDAGNSGGQYRKGNNAVDIGTTTDSGGGYIVESVKPGEWLKYTINAAQSGTYTVGVRVAAGAGGGTFHIMIDGVNVTGTMTVPATGTNTFTTLTKTGVPLAAGQHDVQLVFDSSAAGGTVGTFNWMQFTNTTPPVVPVSPTSLAGSAATFSTVNLNWLDNSTNETGFVIERRALPYGTWTSVATVAANVTSYTDTSASASTLYSYRIRAINAAGQSANSNEASTVTPARQDLTYLSDLPFAGSTLNGWGPIERDQSVGGPNANDGLVMTLNGVTYSKGFGTNAISDASFTLGGAYGTFITDIGVDDHELYDGSVIFQVFADGTKIYDSGVMTPDSLTQSLSLSVVGVQTLRLHVDDAGDGPDFDQADWAGARLLLAPPIVVPQVPGTPSGLSADAVSTAQINLTWADDIGETSYEIQRSIDDINFTQIGAASAGATSYNDGNLLSSTQYFYRIVANNAAGDSGYSAEAAATTFAAPQPAIAPSNLVAAAISQSQINLTWTDNSSDELNFILERSTDGVTFTQIATPAANATSYTDTTGLAAGATYTYRLRAVNAVGPSINSNIATATTPSAPTAPLAPSNLVATALSQTQINLMWSDNSGNETSFIVERSLDGITFTQIATPSANVTTYSDTTGLITGTNYSYRISAINAVGASTPSNVATATVIADPTAPLAPSNLVATAVSQRQVNLSWTDNSNNETGFIIERSADNITFTQIATPTINATSYSDATGLVAGTKFYYRIRAMNAVGASDNSNVASVTTLAAPTLPNAPSNLVATAASSTQINLSWSDNATDETGFVVERSTDNVTFMQIAAPAANATSYSDVSLAAGAQCFYRVSAVNAAGSSAASNVAAATTPSAPLAASNLVATATTSSQINLTWADNATNETGFIVERSTDGVTFTQIAAPAANATSYVDAAGLSSGTKYYYRVRAINAVGASANSPPASATTIASNALPSGWTDGDIGSTGKAGSATYTSGVYTVNGAGAGIGKTSDAMNFASTTLAGNGTITVRVASHNGVAGIMLREGNAANARFVSLTVGVDGKITLSSRNAVGGNIQTNDHGKVTGAVYLRLVRNGNNFTATSSTDGKKWQDAGKVTLALNTTLNAGLMATSLNTTNLASATFDNLSIILG